MTKETFTAETYPFKFVSGFLVLDAFLLLFISNIGWSKYLFGIICLGLAVLLWNFPPPKIEVDGLGIKKRQYSSSGSGLLSRILQPDTECEWSWIHSVSTTRFNAGSFLTTLYLSEDVSNKPKYRVTIESFIFNDYVPILKIIKARAAQAHFDETTEF